MRHTNLPAEESLPNHHEVRLQGVELSYLSETSLLHYVIPGLDIASFAYQYIQANSLVLGRGVFTYGQATDKSADITVEQTADGLLISSSDTCAPKGMLSEAEVLTLIALLKKATFRVFFDQPLRQALLKEKAFDYGLENESTLDDFFELVYRGEELHIIPKLPSLVPITTKSLEEWSGWMDSQYKKATESLKEIETHKQTIVVLKKHKYYHHLMVDLYRAAVSKTGRVKNPLVSINPLEQIWTMEGQQQVKFYAAIQKFQSNIADDDLIVDLEALRALIQNPQGYAFFYHDATIAEKVNASSITPVEVALLPKTVQLQVVKKPPFYEITGSVVLNGNTYSINGLALSFSYFLLAENTLYLVDNPKILGLFRLFKNRPGSMLIHERKYSEFRKHVLEVLETKVPLQYKYVHKATNEQLAQFGGAMEKLVYLSDFDNFIMITPMMRYGEAEIPIRTDRQIHATDDDGNVFAIERDKEAEDNFMALLVRQHPFFEEQLDNELDYLYLHRKRFLDAEWFLAAFETWFEEGITLYGFNELEGNNYNPHRAKITIRILSGIDWFNAKTDIRFGKARASLKQLQTTLRDKRKFVKLDDGTLGVLPQEWIAKFSRYFNIGEILADDTLGIAKTNFTLIQELFEREQLDDLVWQELKAIEQSLASFESITDLPAPKELNTTLRGYQQQGLAWLNFLDDFGFGGCLADDMGLGKTVQIIAFMLAQRHKKGMNTNLLILPTSLIFHWQQEVAKFAPSLQVLIHHAANRGRSPKDFARYDLVLTTYGTLVNDIGWLKDFSFNYVFLDESQNIKNPESQRYKAARLLKAYNRIAITGTPVENNVFDLYAQLSFACPGLLGSKKYFHDVYLRPIDQFHDRKRLKQLQQKVSPFILRRTKKQVAAELPEKTEMVIYSEMESAQRQIYNAYEKEIRDYISATSNEELKKESMHVLRGLTRLRQICDSPLLLGEGRLPGEQSVKLANLMERLEEQHNEHKILVFSQFVSMLELIKKGLNARGIAYTSLTGSTHNREKVVRCFQEDPTIRVFLISLKAGGVGLNLTEADYVYLVDPWWNPAVENQAIDRAHRIGQNKHVVAVRMVCKDTVEEKMMRVQAAKKELFQELIHHDNAFMQNLSKQDLLELLSP